MANMKVQVRVLLNVEINKSDYIYEETDTDEHVLERLHKEIDDGDKSLDELIEQSTDYTIEVVKSEDK